jgi:hypothetical protein
MAETTSPNYPAALADSTSLLGDHSNQLSLTLGATCLVGDAVITTTGAIATGAGGVNAPGYCLIDSEIIHFTGVAGATLTGCTRPSAAAGGGAAAEHASGTTVYFIPTANWANQVKDEIIATQTELGINVAGQPTNLVTRLDRGMLEADNAATEALGGTKTLTDADFALQYLDPNGSNRDVNLPAEAAANHAFVIVNTANAAENLVVKNDAAATIVTVGQNQLGILFSDGTTWKGMVESPTEAGAVTTGIANTNTVVIDHASVADNDFAKFTSSGLEGRSYSETLSDISAIASIVADSTPQLGGQLDVNGNALGDGALELLKFSETGSAVNELTVTNAATGNPPALSATGDDANINLKLAGKGTGGLEIGATADTASKLILAEDTDNGAHTITVAAPAAVTGDITLTLPDGDGDASQFLQTNGSGVLSWAAAGGGGVTEADSWRLTSGFSGDADITANLAQGVGYAGSGFGTLGTGMSESSGAFTFPSTGYWQVFAMFQFRCTCDSTYNQGMIRVTVDNSYYTEHTQTSVALAGTHVNSYSSIMVYALIDVEDITLTKVKFRVGVHNATVSTKADPPGQTSFHFIRLGDT